MWCSGLFSRKLSIYGSFRARKFATKSLPIFSFLKTFGLQWFCNFARDTGLLPCTISFGVPAMGCRTMSDVSPMKIQTRWVSLPAALVCLFPFYIFWFTTVSQFCQEHWANVSLAKFYGLCSMFSFQRTLLPRLPTWGPLVFFENL